MKAPIEHFSTLFFIPESNPSIEELQEQAQEEYDEEVAGEEEELAGKLIAADRTLCFLSCGEDDFSLVAKLLDRTNERIMKVISENEPDPEKLQQGHEYKSFLRHDLDLCLKLRIKRGRMTCRSVFVSAKSYCTTGSSCHLHYRIAFFALRQSERTTQPLQGRYERKKSFLFYQG